jgi:hypothetical protein
MRPLLPLLITPSVDLSELARQHQRDLPYLIQYFVSSLGRDATSCADLMSYLLFTPKYTQALIDIGYQDATRRIDEIEDFLFSSAYGDNGSPPARTTGTGKAKPANGSARRDTVPVRSRG